LPKMARSWPIAVGAGTFCAERQDMDTKRIIKNRLEEGGITVDAELLDRLVPVYRQWRQYIGELRQIELPKEEEPAHIFSFAPRTGATHAE
jgi:hypothetical protein